MSRQGGVVARDIVDTPHDAGPNGPPPLVIRTSLEAFLDAHGLGSGRLEARPIGAGHSNVTLLIERGGRRLVLRRPPRPPWPPSAHDVLREARLLRQLVATEARVPRVLAVCENEAVIGAPFYVMEEIDGVVLSDIAPSWLDSPELRRRVSEEIVDALVELHSIDWRARGLTGFGRPDGYLERQLRRFGALWKHSRTRDLPQVEAVGERLATSRPESPPSTIVHGDYRLGNVMIGSSPPVAVKAVLDWELATVGDPLADVGFLAATWHQPGDRDTQFSRLSAVTRLDGFLTREELIERYAERSGRGSAGLRWYQALALWKAAVFMEGLYRRYVAGATDDPFLRTFDSGVPELIEGAERLLDED